MRLASLRHWFVAALSRLWLVSIAATAFGSAACDSDDSGIARDAGDAEIASNDASVDAAAPAACTLGEARCGCGAGMSCDEGLRCRDALCEACPKGSEGCACSAQDSCDGKLVCLTGRCASSECSAGAVDCPCRDDHSCDDGSACNSETICRACAADLPGCSCRAGECFADLLCEASSDRCRTPASCDDLVKSGGCGENQGCREPKGKDAICVANTCRDGFRWDAGANKCVSCPDCVTGTSCLADPRGIGRECAEAYRSCDLTDGFAACGECLANAEDVEGKCVPRERCGDRVCTDKEYCDRLAQECKTLPCPSGQARGPAQADGCSQCTTACTGNGFTGRFWPFRSKTRQCVCETQPGYFIQATAREAQRCDADLDGWVRREADDSSIHKDEAFLQNARCDLRRVDRVVLRDEYGQSLELRSCRAQGFVADANAECDERMPLRLLETARNDTAGPIPVTPATPKYGANGRALAGYELNGLTKACVSELGNFDDDDADDLTQAQPTSFEAESSDTERLRAFSYFLELAKSYYVPPTEDERYGSLTIEERSRCDAVHFPLHYSSGDAFGSKVNAGKNPPATDPGYWRNCTRFRDASFDEDDPQPASDFEQYACDSPTGSCSDALPGAAHPTIAFDSLSSESPPLRDHGLCELNGAAPADREFRGLLHASQFHCVHVTDGGNPPSELAASELGPMASWTFNTCVATACPPGETCQSSERIADSGGYLPVLSCMPVTDSAAIRGVGYALRKYQPYGSGPLYTNGPTTYESGCINEDEEWGAEICPDQAFARANEALSFGRYSCYGNPQRWLWSMPTGSAVAVSLLWGEPMSGAPNASVWSARPN